MYKMWKNNVDNSFMSKYNRRFFGADFPFYNALFFDTSSARGIKCNRSAAHAALPLITLEGIKSL